MIDNSSWKRTKATKRQESAMIREQSSATDPQQSAEYTTTIMQWTISPCKTPEGLPTGHVLPNGETSGCISSYLTCLNDISWMGTLAGCISLSLTLPKWYLATYKCTKLFCELIRSAAILCHTMNLPCYFIVQRPMCHKINIINFTSSGTILMLGNQQK